MPPVLPFSAVELRTFLNILRGHWFGGPNPPPWSPELDVSRGFPVLALRGSPEEIGTRHGRLLGPQVRHLLDHYVARFLGPPDGWRALRGVCRRFEAMADAEALAELRALAAGADVSYENLLLAHVLPDIYKPGACTAIAVWGRYSGDGILRVGRNLDFPPLGVAHRMTVLLRISPRRGIPFVSIGLPGIVGFFSGLNAAGLCLSSLEVRERRLYRPGEPYILMLRRAIQRHEQVPEVVRLIEASSRTTANILMAADPRPAAAAIEYSPAFVHSRSARDGAITCANHFRVRRRLNLWPHQVSISSVFRNRALDRRVRGVEKGSHPPLDDGDLQRLLARTAMGMINLHAMIIHPEERSLLLSAGRVPAAKGPYVFLSPNELFSDEPSAGGRTEERTPPRQRSPRERSTGPSPRPSA